VLAHLLDRVAAMEINQYKTVHQIREARRPDRTYLSAEPHFGPLVVLINRLKDCGYLLAVHHLPLSQRLDATGAVFFQESSAYQTSARTQLALY
jgi:hypothetical protein